MFVNQLNVFFSRLACSSMSFGVSESGSLSTATLCSFTKTPEGNLKKVVGDKFSVSSSLFCYGGLVVEI